METKWMPVSGYEGYYEVNNHGDVRGCNRAVGSRGSSLKTLPQKMLAPFIIKSGYFCVRLSKDSAVKQIMVHRLVANAFLNNPLVKPMVNHIDGVKTNNCISNLEWVTASENSRHAVATGNDPWRERRKQKQQSLFK